MQSPGLPATQHTGRRLGPQGSGGVRGLLKASGKGVAWLEGDPEAARLWSQRTLSNTAGCLPSKLAHLGVHLPTNMGGGGVWNFLD